LGGESIHGGILLVGDEQKESNILGGDYGKPHKGWPISIN
jgi:hypothetical protein